MDGRSLGGRSHTIEVAIANTEGIVKMWSGRTATLCASPDLNLPAAQVAVVVDGSGAWGPGTTEEGASHEVVIANSGGDHESVVGQDSNTHASPDLVPLAAQGAEAVDVNLRCRLHAGPFFNPLKFHPCDLPFPSNGGAGC